MRRIVRHLGFAALLGACALAFGQGAGDPLAEARSLATSGLLAKSEALVRTYLNANPASADAHFLLGYVLFRQQRARDSLAEFTVGAKYRRPKADEFMTIASDYVLLGDYVDADKWFSEVTRERPDDGDAWYLLGRTQYNEGDYPKAIATFEHALALRPHSIETENNLGLAWRATNQNDKAREAFQTAINWQADHPVDSQPYLNLGTLLNETNQFDEALPNLTQAVALAPDNPRAHEALARAYEATNNLPKAQGELEKAIGLAPKASELHFQLARVYRREGMQEQAKKELDICGKLNGTQSSVDTPNPPK
ncbi:MAG TPA: tetratricopeptide repeat protein [Terracidiphilus sp.]|nr:tetratricopeptide repeat protein [Terracidiphilus sp.]